MPHVRRWLSSLTIAAVMLTSASLSFAQTGDRSPQQLWNDFNHYVLIARPDLAASSGQALLQRTEPSQLLDIVEASDYEDYDQTLDRATRVPELSAVAVRLTEAIAQARLERARDPQRIESDIDRLDDGQRAYANAVSRLRAAGQLAVPPMLQTLQDQEQEVLRPYVTTALVAMGRPAVYPLSVALPHLDDATQQRVARILSEIGYPLALPYLKQVLEDERTPAPVRDTLSTAFDRLSTGSMMDRGATAASLHLTVGRDQYDARTEGETPAGFEVYGGDGLLWRHNRLAGLVSVPVPEAIFADVLAMQSARYALELEPSNDAALRLWLMANLRREQSLPEGEVDPTYGNDRRPPSFYALLAGPAQLLMILDQALQDRDPELALAALRGLDDTAATEALISGGAAAGPMLRAMSFPLATVRFEAAAVMADARPASSYEGADLVTPALGEALRSDDARYAVIVAATAPRATALASMLRELGYVAAAGTPGQLESLRDRVALQPAVDLVLTELVVDETNDVLDQLRNDPRLRATPMVLAAEPADRVRLEAMAEDRPAMTVIDAEPDMPTLTEAVESARAAMTDEAATAEEARERALRALSLLDDIGVGSDVYDLTAAEPALVGVLDDDRQAVATRGAMVVAMLASTDAQRALAERALETSGELQITMLNALADSATRFGNRLTPAQANAIGELTREADDPVALAAARAHGALALPTQSAVERIFDQ